jgi:hypothetical protein
MARAVAGSRRLEMEKEKIREMVEKVSVQVHFTNVMAANIVRALKNRTKEERHLQYLMDAGCGASSHLYVEQQKATLQSTLTELLAKNDHRLALDKLKAMNQKLQVKERGLQLLESQLRI